MDVSPGKCIARCNFCFQRTHDTSRIVLRKASICPSFLLIFLPFESPLRAGLVCNTVPEDDTSSIGKVEVMIARRAGDLQALETGDFCSVKWKRSFEVEDSPRKKIPMSSFPLQNKRGLGMNGLLRTLGCRDQSGLSYTITP